MWNNLESVSIQSIKEVKNTLHQAVQLVALVARHICPKVEDDHFANLNWHPGLSAMVGNPVSIDEVEYRAGFNFSTLELFILKENEVIEKHSLKGKTYQEGFDWIKAAFDALGFDTVQFDLTPPYDIPEYPEANGKPFNVASEEALKVLINSFDNAYHQLTEFKGNHKNVSDIKCWPHHFDLALLQTFPDQNEEASIGIGISPGDESIQEPYFYVNCWPYPDTSALELPALAVGNWVTEGWVGTTLKYSQISESNTQELSVKNYVEGSYSPLKNWIL